MGAMRGRGQGFAGYPNTGGRERDYGGFGNPYGNVPPQAGNFGAPYARPGFGAPPIPNNFMQPTSKYPLFPPQNPQFQYPQNPQFPGQQYQQQQAQRFMQQPQPQANPMSQPANIF